jgi:hypothetical protein
MNYLKSYNKLYEWQDIDTGLNLSNDFFKNIPNDPVDPNYIKLKQIAKQGKLYKYLTTGERQLTFGMLRALHADAMKFKKSREFRQGMQKSLWRLVPMALAPIFLPVWVITQVLGVARALNKVMSQVNKMDNKRYDGFLMNILTKVFEFTEGEIERLTVDDWFYKSFAIEKGLIEMVRKEHVLDFSFYIIKKIQYQADTVVVPPYFIENEFRRYLNRKFKINPPLQLKIKHNRHEKF